MNEMIRQPRPAARGGQKILAISSAVLLLRATLSLSQP